MPAHVIEDLVVGQIRAIGQDRMLQARVLDEVRAQGAEVEPADCRRVFALFSPLWEALHRKERARVLQVLVEGIGYDGATGMVALVFRPTGTQALAEEVAP